MHCCSTFVGVLSRAFLTISAQRCCCDFFQQRVDHVLFVSDFAKNSDCLITVV